MESEMQADILCLSESCGITTILVINYPKLDPASAGGYIYQRKAGTDERSTHTLATNDTLRTLWSSPSGDVWTSSTLGRVWTTADVPWEIDDAGDGLDFDVPEGKLNWRYIQLPRQERDGGVPNTQEIWGTSSDNVFVGSFSGIIYHWNGKIWSQHDWGLGGAIGRFAGTSPKNVYACGYNSSILHFDGNKWQILCDPDSTLKNEIFTGITFGKNGDPFICSMSGRLLQGTKNVFSVVGQYRTPFIDMLKIGDRLLFAATDHGVLELRDGKLETLRQDIIPWSMAKGDNRVYFTETPVGKTVYSEFDVTNDTWRQLNF